jgi:hypothetical protein
MNRRESLKLIAMASLSAGFNWTIADVIRAQELRNKGLAQQKPFMPALSSEPAIFSHISSHWLFSLDTILYSRLSSEPRSCHGKQ